MSRRMGELHYLWLVSALAYSDVPRIEDCGLPRLDLWLWLRGLLDVDIRRAKEDTASLCLCLCIWLLAVVCCRASRWDDERTTHLELRTNARYDLTLLNELPIHDRHLPTRRNIRPLPITLTTTASAIGVGAGVTLPIRRRCRRIRA